MDFCEELEYALCDYFYNCEDYELNGFWCDGVEHTLFFNPDVNRDYLSVENVKQRRDILTVAYLGVGGQDRYSMKIIFGAKSLASYQNGERLTHCIPSIENDSWVKIDPNRKTIEISLL